MLFGTGNRPSSGGPSRWCDAVAKRTGAPANNHWPLVARSPPDCAIVMVTTIVIVTTVANAPSCHSSSRAPVRASAREPLRLLGTGGIPRPCRLCRCGIQRASCLCDSEGASPSLDPHLRWNLRAVIPRARQQKMRGAYQNGCFCSVNCKDHCVATRNCCQDVHPS